MMKNNSEQIINAPQSSMTKVDEAKECYYRCSFLEAIKIVDNNLEIESNIIIIQKLINLKSKALFELNRKEESLRTLQSSIEILSFNLNASYYYAKGSLSYMSGNLDDALKEFKSMLDKDNSTTNSFLALLSIANIKYSLGLKEDAKVFIRELDQLKADVSDEYRISFLLLKGNILSQDQKYFARAKEIFEEAFILAIEREWTFFSQRTLYYLAKLHIRMQQRGKALGILMVLDMFLKTTDWRFMVDLVNNEFKSIQFSSQQKMKLDEKLMNIIVGNLDQTVIELGKWPNLFLLFQSIFETTDYITKEKIASVIWKNQKYLPRTHDARIYDLMSRLKKKIKSTGVDTIFIESKDGAYKLKF